MKTLLRNFFVTLRRSGLSTVLNVLGLSIAFAAFLIIMVQVRYERSFDTHDPNSGRLFRVEMTEDNTQYYSVLPYAAKDLFQGGIPQIEQATMTGFTGGEGVYMTVEQNGQQSGFRELIMMVDSSFSSVFHFDMVEGRRDALSLPDHILIPQSMALRMFGHESALEQAITLSSGEKMLVGGVYKDFPQNSSLQNVLYLLNKNPSMFWGQLNHPMYVLLHNADSRERVEAQMMELLRGVDFPFQFVDIKAFRLTPLPNLYYTHDTTFDMTPKGSRSTSQILLGIAILVIVIAGINFVNFSTSLAPLRMKSINTRKVLGSTVAALRTGLLAEALGICLLAFGIALLLTWLAGFTSLVNYLNAPISLSANLSMVVLTFGMAVVVGLAAGLYPAWYTTSFPPALVLKGSFGLSPKGRKLRTALIGFQYVISIGLIIAAVFMQLQNRYVQSRDMGFEKERIAISVLASHDLLQESGRIAEELKRNASVQDVAFGSSAIGAQNYYSKWGHVTPEGETIMFNVIDVTWNMLPLLGLEMVEGRDFREEDLERDVNLFIINEVAQAQMQLKPGDRITEGTNGEVTGVVRNFNFQSLHHTIEPMAFLLSKPSSDLSCMYVRTTGDPRQITQQIRGALAAVDPAFPAEVQFYDSLFERLYESDRKTTGLVTIFSLLAIVISLVGVFGLVMFETQYRRKEIGVRKVFGASIQEVLSLFNRSFVRIVLVCFVLAAPVAWYGIDRWLGSFAYRTPIYWWVFALSLGIVLLITLSTVTLQSWRAATANPVKALRSE